ncbi:Ger(x)C family spore germination protein [Heliophilum fasciatum]|uniref:Ger(X)C family germination protein n=1 Tax=Heliophilum fasciatum TaxID=35700 RepID=A0A4R2RD86_9FIRM|nr:Ger(x)C family spore germination protein [Heliophilum fasciatum]MCW2279341.1 Ger(x)C family germination protein [Heliophilum fasciatum]TCP60773.1 Ger(x)C family germination protein [Heliophilum fasciatum]
MQPTWRRRVLCFTLQLSCLTLLLAGCWDRNELEQLAFVLTLGIDRSVDNQIDVMLRVAVPVGVEAGPGKKAGGGTVSGTTKVLTVTARSVPEAISLAEATIERQIDFRHLRIVVFGEQLAKEGLLPYLDVFERYHQFRRSTYIWIAKEGAARHIFLTTDPVLEKSVSRYAEDLARLVPQLSFFRMATLHEFINETDSPQVDAVLPIVAVNPIVEREKKENNNAPLPTDEYHQQLPENPEPGGKTLAPLYRSGGNPSEFLGVAVFHQGKLVDKWSGWETRDYSLLRDTYKRSIWVFPSPTGLGFFSLQLHRTRAPQITITDVNDVPHIDIALSLEGNLLGIQSLEPYVSSDKIADLEAYAAGQIQSQIAALIQKAQRQKVDPFYFVRFLRTKMLTMKELDELNWREHFAQATVTVAVDIKIRRPGLRIQPRERETP